ncbi:hypothetical protein D3C85_1360120 [compost metagenome]
MLASLSGLPMLMICPLQASFSLSMIRARASTPSAMSVKQRFCSPPSNRRMGVPSTRLRISWVIARELPIRAESRRSRRGPIQLNGRNRVKFRPFWPYAQITRSNSCLETE